MLASRFFRFRIYPLFRFFSSSFLSHPAVPPFCCPPPIVVAEGRFLECLSLRNQRQFPRLAQMSKAVLGPLRRSPVGEAPGREQCDGAVVTPV